MVWHLFDVKPLPVLTELDIKHLVNMPVGQMALKIYVPCKNFMCPANNYQSHVKLIMRAKYIAMVDIV